ncbi:hypothetical protein SDC9_147294 [bioreactor metagenome]|uniref:Uncharacterized protein n=1 Tax=bioreactor metagenome TaxID=1076179 RepID=A0A645EFH5_9ZZZZ
MVVYQFAVHSGYGKFPSRVDVEQNHFIEQRQAVGKFFIEVTRAAIQVRLKNSCNLSVGIKFANRHHALLDFGRMVCIVTQEDNLFIL